MSVASRKNGVPWYSMDMYVVGDGGAKVHHLYYARELRAHRAVLLLLEVM